MRFLHHHHLHHTNVVVDGNHAGDQAQQHQGIQARLPAHPKQVDLAEEASQGRNATQGQQRHTQTQGQQGIFLVKPRVFADLIRARAQGEQNHAGETAQVHEQINQQVKHHAGVAVGGVGQQPDRHEAGLPDRGISQHPLHAGLGQGHHVPQHHTQNGQGREHKVPLFRHQRERRHQQANGQGEPSRLGTHGQKGHHRSGRAFIHVGSPLVEGHSRNLEGNPRDREDQRHHNPNLGRGRVAGNPGGNFAQAGVAAREAIKQRSAVEEDGRARSPNQQIFESRFVGARIPLHVSRQQVGRDTEGFQRHKNHHQLVSARQEHPANRCREQNDDEFAQGRAGGFHIGDRHQDCDCRRQGDDSPENTAQGVVAEAAQEGNRVFRVPLEPQGHHGSQQTGHGHIRSPARCGPPGHEID